VSGDHEPFTQSIRVVEFDRERFVDDLKIKAPPFSEAHKAHFQLRYLAAYVADEYIACKSLLIEEPYIDRDHMEDHSVFYSRNLFPYQNYCRRIHFFRLPPAEITNRLRALRDSHRTAGQAAYRSACATFSEDHYIGFAVVKPLEGTPVGRTIFRTFPAEKKGHPTYRRHFTCTRLYKAHVAGVELTVRGLPFQQQDKAVAACATTAVWSALHRTREFEDIATFTPAQITALATRSSLEHGRSMPSEGLSIDQMCQAVQAIGISPILRSAPDPRAARGLLYSSLRSGVAPILIVTNGVDFHAVTAVGMGLREDRNVDVEFGIGDAASRLEAIYVHDDRIGPYLRADLEPRGGRLFLALKFFPDKKLQPQWWSLTHLLFPMHAKVRVTFGELRNAAVRWVATRIETYRKELEGRGVAEARQGPIEYETWIEPAPAYQREMLRNSVASDVSEGLVNEISFSRYVGVIRVTAPFIDPIQVLIDTTSTERNIFAIAVLAETATKPATRIAAEYLASYLDCSKRLFVPQS
jgi:hypothetical protein